MDQVSWKINKDIIVKEESETNPDYGTPPYKRPISQHIRFGLINLARKLHLGLRSYLVLNMPDMEGP
jgi:hypothetical protein